MTALHPAIDTTDPLITATFGSSRTHTVWTDRRTHAWPDLARVLTTHSVGAKDGPCILPAAMRGTRRTKEDADQIDVAFLDSDTGVDMAVLENAVRQQGWSGVVASTHSHMTTTTRVNRSNWDRWRAKHPNASEAMFLIEDKQYLPHIAAYARIMREDGEFVYFEHQPCPKFRVALPLMQPWRAADYQSQDAANAAWAERIETLAATLGLQHDQSCTDTSRLFYLPRHPRSAAPPESVVIDGALCDLFSLPPRDAGLFTARPGSNGAGNGKAPASDDLHEFIDPNSGEVFDLRDWARAYGHRFLIADALRARKPSVLTGHVADRIKVHCRCPNENAHTEPGADGATIVINAGAGRNAGFAIHCRHAHCTGLDRLAFIRMMLEQDWLSIPDLTAREFLTDRPPPAPNGTPRPSEPPPADDDSASTEQPVDGHTDTKRPLFRPQTPAPNFPIHALGALRDPVEALQMRTQAPLAMCAQSILAAVTLAAQAHRNIELPSAGVRPLTGLYGSTAESGERKSTVDRVALAPVYRIEEGWRETRDVEIADFVNDQSAWKAARDTAVKKGNGNRSAIKAALDAIGPEPSEPPQPMLLIADPTPQALVLHLQKSRPWGGLFTAEGGILLGGTAFADESRLHTGALLNVLWDGDPIRRARVGTGYAFLPGRRCSAHIMMQGVVADRLFGNAMLDGIGLLARFLVVAPDSTAGTRLFREPPAVCRSILDDYNARLTALLLRPPALAPGTTDVLDPPVMSLSATARRDWILFYNTVERDVADAGKLRSIRAFGAKMAEHAGRLAAVLATYADPDGMEVDGNAMTGGIALAQFYAAEMLRLQSAGAVACAFRWIVNTDSV